jgi:hypothetical protein
MTARTRARGTPLLAVIVIAGWVASVSAVALALLSIVEPVWLFLGGIGVVGWSWVSTFAWPELDE